MTSEAWYGLRQQLCDVAERELCLERRIRLCDRFQAQMESLRRPEWGINTAVPFARIRVQARRELRRRERERYLAKGREE